MRELTSITLDLVLDVDQVADRATAWTLSQPAVAATVDAHNEPEAVALALKIAAMKAVQLVQAEVHEVAASLDRIRQEQAEG